MTGNACKVLVVEDDPAVRNLVSTALGSRGYRHAEVATGTAALAALTADAPDVLLLDLGLPDMAGVAIDRFGRDVAIREIEDGNAFRLRCRVDISPQFFGWLAGLGSGVRILEPQQTVEEYRAWISGILEHMKDQA